MVFLILYMIQKRESRSKWMFGNNEWHTQNQDHNESHIFTWKLKPNNKIGIEH